MNKKFKIAFIKFGLLSNGGTEAFLHTIATSLPKDKYDITAYYTNAAPYIGSDWKHPDNTIENEVLLKNHGIHLVKVHVDYKDLRQSHHPWLGTDFWDLFDENNFDLIINGLAGHPEFPFTHITNTPILQIVTLPGMCGAERNSNVKKVIHISKNQLDSWVKAGGLKNKAVVVPIFKKPYEKTVNRKWIHKEANLPNDTFLFGMHQRNDPGIFSDYALKAFSVLLKTSGRKDIKFCILGGSEKHREQAKNLGISDNVVFFPHTSSIDCINNFLASLDVYCHARLDGETYGLAIAEAMFHSKPILSHIAPAMGHLETIGPGGIVVPTVTKYHNVMSYFLHDLKAREKYGKLAKEHYEKNLSYNANMAKIEAIFDEIFGEIERDKNFDELSWDEVC